jgi:hypothetical protein
MAMMTMTMMIMITVLTMVHNNVPTLAETRGDVSTSSPLTSHLAVGLGVAVKGMAIWNSCPALTVMSFTLDRSILGFSVNANATVASF